MNGFNIFVKFCSIKVSISMSKPYFEEFNLPNISPIPHPISIAIFVLYIRYFYYLFLYSRDSKVAFKCHFGTLKPNENSQNYPRKDNFISLNFFKFQNFNTKFLVFFNKNPHQITL